jgi:hypothetical protein
MEAVHAPPPERCVAHVLVEEDPPGPHPRERVGERLLLRCRRNVMHDVQHRDGAIEPVGKPVLDRAMLELEPRC